jgi:DnaJ-class molecular chaperone
MTISPLHFVGVERECRFCHGTGVNVYGHCPCICNGTGFVTVARLVDEQEVQLEMFAAEDEAKECIDY